MQLQVRVNEKFKKVKHLAANDMLLVTAVKGKMTCTCNALYICCKPWVDCTCRYPFHRNFGRIEAWILFWVCLAFNVVWAQFLWWSIDFQIWLTLLPCYKKTTDVSKVAIFFHEVYRLHGCQAQLFQIGTLSFWVLFKGACGSYTIAYHPKKDGQTDIVNRSLGNIFTLLSGWKSRVVGSEVMHCKVRLQAFRQL